MLFITDKDFYGEDWDIIKQKVEMMFLINLTNIKSVKEIIISAKITSKIQIPADRIFTTLVSPKLS